MATTKTVIFKFRISPWWWAGKQARGGGRKRKRLSLFGPTVKSAHCACVCVCHDGGRVLIEYIVGENNYKCQQRDRLL